jgi:hypothetical protein
MKTTRRLLPCLLGVLLLAGCRAQYQAHAKVQVDTGGSQPTQATIDSEVQVIRTIAASLVGADGRFEVRQIPNTALIEVSVTTPDSKASAKSCDQIVEKYVGMNNSTVSKKIIERAVVHSQPTQ